MFSYSMRTSRARYVHSLRGVISGPQSFVRFSSTSAAAPETSTIDTPPQRWLADVKKRIAKCVSFGLRPMQVDEAGNILRVLARDWKELLAGSEGFLVGMSRAGLERHRVVWGEMVCAYGDLYGSGTRIIDVTLFRTLW